MSGWDLVAAVVSTAIITVIAYRVGYRDGCRRDRWLAMLEQLRDALDRAGDDAVPPAPEGEGGPSVDLPREEPDV